MKLRDLAFHSRLFASFAVSIAGDGLIPTRIFKTGAGRLGRLDSSEVTMAERSPHSRSSEFWRGLRDTLP